MSTFKWVIYDATDGVASTQQGGSVELEDARVTNSLPQWSIKQSDGAVALVPQTGGEIELTEKPRQLSSMVNPGALNFAFVFLVLAVGLVLLLDAWRGNVTFEKFLYVLAPFIAGFTAGKVKRAL